MRRGPLLAALALATAVSGIAAWREISCGSCSGSLPLGLIGSAFYAALWISVALLGPRRPLSLAVVAAFGLHAGLVGVMVLRGPFCGACLLAAAASLLVVAALVVGQRSLLRDLAVLAPWTAAAAFVLPLHPPIPEATGPSGAELRLSIYTRDGCRYCEELRNRILPEAMEGLEGRVEVRWIQAPPALRVPGIALSRDDRTGGRYIEGLPPADFLRSEMDKFLAVTP